MIKNKILIVDDSKTQITQLHYILAKEGWSVFEAENGEKALELLCREPVDLIILDYHLPGIKGDDLCKQIKLHNEKLPVLMFTQDKADTSKEKLFDSGADDLISKSADYSILIQKVKKILTTTPAIYPFSQDKSIDFSRIKILAVDDSPTYLQFLLENLKKSGFDIETTTNGATAIEKLTNNTYDCVLVDLLMPEINGIELCNKIQQSNKISNTIVILMLTEHENKEFVTQALEAGADDFVGKSSDMSVIQARIRALLRRKIILDENQRIFEELKMKELEIERTNLEKKAIEEKASLSEQLQETVKKLEAEIGEKNRIENELKRSNEDLEQFAYVASHDLKEPLRIVTSFTGLIEDRYSHLLDEKGKDFISRIVGAAGRMINLIEDLLSYSRVTTQAKPFEKCNALEIVQEAIKNLKYTIDEKKAILQVENLPEISVDRSQIIRVFQNLLSNSLKYCDQRPEIHISAQEEKEKNMWLFYIKDNGIGMKEKYLEKIFEIFQRLHTRTQYDGTGIGLAITKKIIERHHGVISVQSELGKGTTFYFSIPKEN